MIRSDDPAVMTPQQRLRAIAALLALGCRRLAARSAEGVTDASRRAAS